MSTKSYDTFFDRSTASFKFFDKKTHWEAKRSIKAVLLSSSSIKNTLRSKKKQWSTFFDRSSYLSSSLIKSTLRSKKKHRSSASFSFFDKEQTEKQKEAWKQCFFHLLDKEHIEKQLLKLTYSFIVFFAAYLLLHCLLSCN